MPPQDVQRHSRRHMLGVAGFAFTMHAGPPFLMTLSDWLRADRTARKDALQFCLKKIGELDPSIHAWVRVHPQAPTGQGELSDIPFGVKDIIDTQNFPTEFGSPVYKGRQSASDAAIVRDLRQRGAVLLGKTHTAAFAYRSAPPTRNPRNRKHTPGGSSSGSAAAVAAGMAPFAIGTQTRGSVLRPASYCGVTGFKPSYGLLPTEGVLSLSQSLDTVGFFTHTAADMLLLWDRLGNSRASDEDFALGVPEPMPEVEGEMAKGFRRALSALRSGGRIVKTVKITPMLTELDAAASLVMTYEGARFHEQRYREFGSRLGRLADLVREGLQMPRQQYDEARRFIARSKEQMSGVFKTTPVILTPAATGPAPSGLASTGDPRMNAPWTALGTPAISIPMPVGKALPLGLQLTADHGHDGRLLAAAVRLEQILNSK